MITKITLTKSRSTWHYVAHNDQGGSFGSNHCGSKKVALHKAAIGAVPGQYFTLIVNGQSAGYHTVDAAGRVVKA